MEGEWKEDNGGSQVGKEEGKTGRERQGTKEVESGMN